MNVVTRATMMFINRMKTDSWCTDRRETDAPPHTGRMRFQEAQFELAGAAGERR